MPAQRSRTWIGMLCDTRRTTDRKVSDIQHELETSTLQHSPVQDRQKVIKQRLLIRSQVTLDRRPRGRSRETFRTSRLGYDAPYGHATSVDPSLVLRSSSRCARFVGVLQTDELVLVLQQDEPGQLLRGRCYRLSDLIAYAGGRDRQTGRARD
jgi:peptidoglycan/xylan/chitin deacetylase (PgdA/CDA1 family)